MKKGKMIVSNRALYTFIFLGIALFVLGGIYAYNAANIPNPGHGGNEIWVTASNNVEMTLQDAIRTGKMVDWSGKIDSIKVGTVYLGDNQVAKNDWSVPSCPAGYTWKINPTEAHCEASSAIYYCGLSGSGFTQGLSGAPFGLLSARFEGKVENGQRWVRIVDTTIDGYTATGSQGYAYLTYVPNLACSNGAWQKVEIGQKVYCGDINQAYSYVMFEDDFKLVGYVNDIGGGCVYGCSAPENNIISFTRGPCNLVFSDTSGGGSP